MAEAVTVIINASSRLLNKLAPGMSRAGVHVLEEADLACFMRQALSGIDCQGCWVGDMMAGLSAAQLAAGPRRPRARKRRSFHTIEVNEVNCAVMLML